MGQGNHSVIPLAGTDFAHLSASIGYLATCPHSALIRGGVLIVSLRRKILSALF